MSAGGAVRTGLVLVGALAFVASFVTIGADTFWLVALGDHIRAHGIPEGVPFAAADSHEWPNILVIAQVILSVVSGWGAAALPALQLVVDATTLALVAVGARRLGASDRATAGALALVALGTLPSLVVVKLQIFSLVPFALLLLLLRDQHRRPTRAIWLLPVLVAVWTNLHGAVLLGVAVVGAYLLFSRLRVRTVETLVVGPLVLLALLATPQGWRTVEYYVGVMGNEAAAQGAGMWARLSPTAPFDVALMLAAAILLVGALRRRLPLWEYVVLLGLAVGTATAARHGVWLVLALAAPAAVGFTRRPAGETEPTPVPVRAAPAVLLAGALAALSALIALPLRGTTVLPESPDVVDELVARTQGRVVLAPEPLVESLAVAGATVWAANPIDAFDPEVQRTYLDFLDEGTRALGVAEVTAVVVPDGGDQAEVLDQSGEFEKQALEGDWSLYFRR